jgi:hypothetical protein
VVSAWDKLNGLVTEPLVARLFDSARLTDILSSLGGRAEKEEGLSARIVSIQQEFAEAEDKLKRL